MSRASKMLITKQRNKAVQILNDLMCGRDHSNFIGTFLPDGMYVDREKIDLNSLEEKTKMLAVRLCQGLVSGSIRLSKNAIGELVKIDLESENYAECLADFKEHDPLYWLNIDHSSAHIVWPGRYVVRTQKYDNVYLPYVEGSYAFAREGNEDELLKRRTEKYAKFIKEYVEGKFYEEWETSHGIAGFARECLKEDCTGYIVSRIFNFDRSMPSNIEEGAFSFRGFKKHKVEYTICDNRLTYTNYKYNVDLGILTVKKPILYWNTLPKKFKMRDYYSSYNEWNGLNGFDVIDTRHLFDGLV